MIGNLKAAISATHLPVDLIVVSDHGMAKIAGEGETLGADASLDGFETAGGFVYGESEADADRVYNQLKKLRRISWHIDLRLRRRGCISR